MAPSLNVARSVPTARTLGIRMCRVPTTTRHANTRHWRATRHCFRRWTQDGLRSDPCIAGLTARTAVVPIQHFSPCERHESTRLSIYRTGCGVEPDDLWAGVGGATAELAARCARARLTKLDGTGYTLRATTRHRDNTKGTSGRSQLRDSDRGPRRYATWRTNRQLHDPLEDRRGRHVGRLPGRTRVRGHAGCRQGAEGAASVQ